MRVFQVLFRFALAVFKSSEEQLLKCQDHMSIFNFLRQMPEKVTDANTLSQVSPIRSECEFFQLIPMYFVSTNIDSLVWHRRCQFSLDLPIHL